ncbi:hypothetical protein [Clostridium sp. DL1XJH146]
MDKKKLENFWYYNKTKTIIGIIVIFVIGSLIMDMINKDDIVLQAYLLNGYAEKTKTIALEEQLASQLQLPNKQIISISSINDGETNADIQTAFSVKFSTGSIDVLVLNEEDFYAYAKDGAFIDISKEKDSISTKGLQFVGKSLTDSENIYGIKLPENTVLDSLDYDTKDKVIAIAALSSNKDLAMEFLKHILE